MLLHKEKGGNGEHPCGVPHPRTQTVLAKDPGRSLGPSSPLTGGERGQEGGEKEEGPRVSLYGRGVPWNIPDSTSSTAGLPKPRPGPRLGAAGCSAA